jgi:DNA topoisomerase-2
MHLFDAHDKLEKYSRISDIIDAYYDVRLELYGTRKDYMIDALEKELLLLSNKAKYIKENLDGTIDLRKKKREHVIQLLEEKGYDKIEGDDEYKYLVKMPMDSVTEENVDRLMKERGGKQTELEVVKATTIHQMWKSELDKLREQYIEYKEDRARLLSGEEKKKKVVSKGTVKKVAKKEIIAVDCD